MDIMGVNGYKRLESATAKNIPTLMLTAHALSPEDFFKFPQEGRLCLCS
jgi:hypothetical protein